MDGQFKSHNFAGDNRALEMMKVHRAKNKLKAQSQSQTKSCNNCFR